MIEIFIAAALLQEPPATAPIQPEGERTPVTVPDFSRTTDAEICNEMRAVAARVMQELPIMVDTTTRVDGVSVVCGLRVITWNRSIIHGISEMREGWQARKQNQWNQIVCEDPLMGAMTRRGWRVVQNTTFLSGERITQVGQCPPTAPER